MPSTFMGLSISSSGLAAYQTALNVTGNNISNVETAGYSRQVANLQASQALRTYNSYGQIGTGVTVTDITQIRDAFYDNKYWSNNSNYGEYNIKNYYMTQIEGLFYEDEDSAGYVNAFNSVFNSLETLMNNPSDTTYRTSFVNSAEALCDYFNDLYTGLRDIQKSANDDIKVFADAINGTAQQIYTLNKQINTIEQTGVTANELRDKRALLIDQLAQIVPVEVTEAPILTKDGYDSGASSYVVQVCGQTLVDTSGYNIITCVARAEKVNQTDADGLYDLQWSNGIDANFTTPGSSGKLKALFDIRDGNNASYFSGTIKGLDAPNSTVTVSTSSYSSLYEMNLNASGTVQLGTKQVEYDGYTVHFDEGTGKYDVTFQLLPTSGVTVSDSLIGKPASVGDPVDYAGVPYYMSQINEFVRAFSESTNQIFSKGENLYGNQGSSLFTGTSVTGSEYDFTISGSYSVSTNGLGESVVSVTPDSSETASPETTGNILINQKYYSYKGVTYDSATNTYQFVMDASIDPTWSGKASIVSAAGSTSTDNILQLTAGNFRVVNAVIKDSGLLGTTYDIHNAKDNVDILKQFKGILDDANELNIGGTTANDFLSCVLSDIAVDASTAKTFETNYDNNQSIIDRFRQSVSGVDNDEEAMKLVEYQNAYNLNAKMIQTLTEIYDQLILRTGV